MKKRNKKQSRKEEAKERQAEKVYSALLASCRQRGVVVKMSCDVMSSPGYYYPIEKVIKLATENDSLKLVVLAHELGHHNTMPKGLKYDDWDKVEAKSVYYERKASCWALRFLKKCHYPYLKEACRFYNVMYIGYVYNRKGSADQVYDHRELREFVMNSYPKIMGY